jgi:hypothetical protein
MKDHLVCGFIPSQSRYFLLSDNMVAFIAIGHTATAVGSEMKPFLGQIMDKIKRGLQMRG